MQTGFVKVDNSLIREIAITTNAQTALLYVIILSHRNTQEGYCFPSRSVLANEIGLSPDSVGLMLNKLEENKFLQINSGKQNICNNYYFPRESFYKDNEPLIVYRKRSNKFRKQPKENSLMEYIFSDIIAENNDNREEEDLQSAKMESKNESLEANDNDYSIGDENPAYLYKYLEGLTNDIKNNDLDKELTFEECERLQKSIKNVLIGYKMDDDMKEEFKDFIEVIQQYTNRTS